MDLARARESLKAAEMCLESEYQNSAVSRAYYAMFQAAQLAIERAGIARSRWSHPALQSALASKLIHHRKIYPSVCGEYLSTALRARHSADYGDSGVTSKIARRTVRRATAFVRAVEEEVERAPGR